MFIHIGKIHKNNNVFLLEICVFEIINAAGYPNNKHIDVDIAAKYNESHNILKYMGLKNFMKFSNVKCIVVSPFDSFVVILYKNTKNAGKAINKNIQTT